MKASKHLTEQEIVEYLKNHNIDPSICYCKDCGKFLAYDNKHFSIHAYTDKLLYNNNNGGLSFLTTRDYNGNTYRLCRCYDCVCEKFPEFKNVKFKFAHKAAKYTQYGFDVPDEDFKPVSTARQAVTKEKMIKKYGLNEGEQRWNEYCKKQSVTNSFEYKNKKYGMTEEEFDAYNNSRAVTLDNMVKRYGEEEGNKKWNEYVERQRYTCSEEYFIETYGEIIGKEKYRNFIKQRNGGCKISNTAVSEISLELFQSLKKYYSRNAIKYGSDEIDVEVDNGHFYFVDYYDFNNDIVIEFFGSYYHMDPKKYTDDYILRDGSTAKEKREKDYHRLELIQEKLGCKVIVVWESTYRSDKQGTVEAIIKMIENKDQLQNITYI